MNNNYQIGDFVTFINSNYPSIIISIDNNNNYLITIHEYNGDYKFARNNEINKIDLSIYEKLSVLANYGNWFYECHKNLYQELIIESLI
jgi:hypothetical protein